MASPFRRQHCSERKVPIACLMWTFIDVDIDNEVKPPHEFLSTKSTKKMIFFFNFHRLCSLLANVTQTTNQPSGFFVFFSFYLWTIFKELSSIWCNTWQTPSHHWWKARKATGQKRIQSSTQEAKYTFL